MTLAARLGGSRSPAVGGRRLTRLAAVGLAAVTLAAVPACTAAPIPPPVTVTPAIESVRANPPEPQIPLVWPLTGVVTDVVAQRPAIAVKVENTSAARPQSGLEDADVVWETIVEFQVSRFVAVFHSRMPEAVGPIRSVRPMDPLIIAPLHGMLAFSGGQSGIVALARDSGAQLLSHDAGAPGLARVSFRSAPHNVYGTMQTFLDQADASHSAPPAEQFVFALRPLLASAVLSGTPATSLNFRLSTASRPSWAWDAETARWLRSEGSSAAMSRDGGQLSAVNVVAITADHPNTRFRAQGGAAVPTYNLVGEGTVVVATAGRVITGVWRKTAQDAPLQLFLPDGSPLTLAPGNTWVELIPAGSGSLTVG